MECVQCVSDSEPESTPLPSPSLHLLQCLQYHGSPELMAGEGEGVEDEIVEEERKLIDQILNQTFYEQD